MAMKKLLAIGIVLLGGAVVADDWPQFRGVNASGVSPATGLPVEFGPQRNVVWKTALPPGHSSPVLTRDRIFVTGWEADKLLTICLDRATGKILWRRDLTRPRVQELHKANSPASPSPVTDGRNVYVFFADFGLLSYGPDGRERWRLPLGPFNNPFGVGASPILAGDRLLMICDSETGSFFLAVDKDTGKMKWRVERPEYTRGFSTPVLYHPKDGPLQVIVSGSLQLTSYSVDTGEPLWWVRGSTWQMKSTPVLDGDAIYVHGWAGGADVGQQEDIPPFEDVLKKWDANADGGLAREEIADPRAKKDWSAMDLDRDGVLGERDWRMYRSRRSVQNAVRAIRLGGRGDMTDHSIRWRYLKSLPNVPSPLLYKNVLYLLKEGGIFTTLDPSSGEVLKQARLTGAPGDYFSSPVGADDKVYTVSEACQVSVLKAGGQWEVLAVNDLDDSCNATPALAEGRLYIRTRSALYCFGK